MKKKYFIIAAVAVIVFFAAGAVAAAPRVRIITARLGGVAGDIFRLDGELRVRSLFVRDSLDAKYDNTISKLSAKSYKAAIDELAADQVQAALYDNTKSGLSATTIQTAIDETGIKLSKLVSGTALTFSGVKKSALASTTWKGTVTYLDNNTITTSAEQTVAFTPTTETTGTWSSTPANAFNIVSNTTAVSGSYQIVGNSLFLTYTWNALPASVVSTIIDIHGNTITIDNTNHAGGVTLLTKQ